MNSEKNRYFHNSDKARNESFQQYFIQFKVKRFRINSFRYCPIKNVDGKIIQIKFHPTISDHLTLLKIILIIHFQSQISNL